MKKTIDLIEQLKEMGFGEERVLTQIDADLDSILGFENRHSLLNETIADNIYDDIFNGFLCEGFTENEIRKFDKNIITDSQFELICENPFVESVENLGLSGYRIGYYWYDVQFSDGTNIDIYTR